MKLILLKVADDLDGRICTVEKVSPRFLGSRGGLLHSNWSGFGRDFAKGSFSEAAKDLRL